MKIKQILGVIILATFLVRTSSAEESTTRPLTSLSSTVISGYVDTSILWSSESSTSVQGFAGTWIGVITEQKATNRIEFYIIVDENGNLAGRGLNFDRNLGSDQLNGTLNKNGNVKIGQT